LQYVPFAALPEPVSVLNDQSPDASGLTADGGTPPKDYAPPLAIEHEVVVLPSALTLAVLRREIAGRKPAPRAVAVLADPVFDKDDERVKAALSHRKSAQPAVNLQARTDSANLRSDFERSARESGWGEGELRIGRLPFTRKEAQVIADLVPASGQRQALDFEASRAIASSAELSQYRIVHFATHGFLNGMHPELSGVVLSLVDEQGRQQDGFLRAHEIYNLKLPAELVVLSGCRTGLGKEIKGEGIVGLTRAFMVCGRRACAGEPLGYQRQSNGRIHDQVLSRHAWERAKASGCGSALGAGFDVERKTLAITLLLGSLCPTGRTEVRSYRISRRSCGNTLDTLLSK